jgi:hypothetical protein
MLSPEEFLRCDFPWLLVALEWALAMVGGKYRLEASRVRRWCRKVIEFSGDVLLGFL